MNISLRRQVRAFVVIVASGCIAACSLVDPIPVLPTSYQDEINFEKSSVPDHARSIRAGIDFADRARRELSRHISDRQRFLRGLAIGEIILAGTLAVDDKIDLGSDYYDVGAIAGLTGLAIGHWLQPNNEEEVLYGIAIKAIDCAVSAVQPLEGVPETSIPIKALGDSISELGGAKEGLLSHGAYMRPTQKRLKAFVESRVASADALLQTAEQLLIAGVNLEAKLGSSGGRLEHFVHQTHLKLTEKIIADPRGIEDIRNAIKDLVLDPAEFIQFGDPSTLVAGGLAPPEPDSEKRDRSVFGEVPTLSSALAEYSAAYGKTRSAAKRVEAIVQAAEFSKSAEALKACGIDVTPPMPGVRVSPVKIDLVSGESRNVALSITGGTGKYDVLFLGEHPGLSVSKSVEFSKVVTLRASEKTKPGVYQLRVVDTSVKPKMFDIPVTVGSAKTTKPSDVPSAAARNCSAPGVGHAQNLLGWLGFKPGPVDCICAERTRTAISGYAVAAALDMIPSCTGLSALTVHMATAFAALRPDHRNPEGVKRYALELLLEKVHPGKVTADGFLSPSEQALLKCGRGALSVDQAIACLKSRATQRG